jgi:hypothetical protein
MPLIKRDTSKKAKATKAVRRSSKAAKKTVKAWGIKKVVQKVVPKRALLAIGGGLAGLGALLTVRRKKKSEAAPAPTWTPPPAPPAPPAGAPSTEPPPVPPQQS